VSCSTVQRWEDPRWQRLALLGPLAARSCVLPLLHSLLPSHHHKCLRLEGASRGHLVQPPAQVWPPRAGCAGPCPVKFSSFPCLQGRGLQSLPGQPGLAPPISPPFPSPVHSSPQSAGVRMFPGPPAYLPGIPPGENPGEIQRKNVPN